MSRLYYDTPADWVWEKALPIGNGKMGAMVYGESCFEHLQINEDSVWAGGFVDRNNYDALDNLEKVRKLILDGKIPEAENLLKYAFSGTPQSMGPYQTLGDVYIDFSGRLENPTNYERELSLDEAIVTVKSASGTTGVTYIREIFASAQNGCIVVNIKADKPEQVFINASMQRGCFYEWTEHTDDTLYLGGVTDGNGVEYCAGMRVIPNGGKVYGLGEHIVVEGADSVMILITADTTFREENPKNSVISRLDSVCGRSFADIKAEHIEDYRKLFDRTKLTLCYDKELDKLPTNERLARINKDTPDNGLVSTYFDFGRYLLISSSRPGTLPANLQGVWCKDFSPAWQSKYTININTEMNYWPACVCNLAECEEPLFDLLERMKVNGEVTAKTMYGCRGFVAHHNTNIWGDCAPQDICISSTYWVMGGAWLSTHIYKHYLYTGDKDFLKRMYPVLKSAVTFFHDFLIEVEGELVTCPSISPENTYIMENGTSGKVCYGPAMDSQILTDLFGDYLEAVKIVGEEDNAFVAKTEEILSKLPKIKVGKHGQVMEWNRDYDEAEPGHRHISHLYALYPAGQITVDGTPELAKAARITLERRLSSGGGHTGWSRAWIMNMYASLWDAEAVYDNLIALFKKSTLENLFDNHPPFQIDGNFGSVAAIAGMFIQSNDKRTVILPALPANMADGKLSGIVASGGAVYDIIWKDMKLVGLMITAGKCLYETVIVYEGKTLNIKMEPYSTRNVAVDELR